MIGIGWESIDVRWHWHGLRRLPPPKLRPRTNREMAHSGGLARAVCPLVTSHVLSPHATRLASRHVPRRLTDAISSAHAAAIAELSTSLSQTSAPVPTSLSAFGEWAEQRRREAAATLHRAIRAVASVAREALRSEATAFRLGRFPAFIEAVASTLEEALAHAEM